MTHKGQTTDPNTEQRGIGQKLKDAVTSKNSAGNSANVNNPHHVSTHCLPGVSLADKCFSTDLWRCFGVLLSGPSCPIIVQAADQAIALLAG